MHLLKKLKIILLICICYNSYAQIPLSNYSNIEISDTFHTASFIYTASPIGINGGVKRYLIDLKNNCNAETYVVIDINTMNVPDRFSIYDNDSLHIISTPLVGANGPNLGYIEFYPPFPATQWIYPPTNHYFYGSNPRGLLRIIIKTNSSHLHFITFLNNSASSIFSTYIHEPYYTSTPDAYYIYEYEEVCPDELTGPDTISISQSICDTILITNYIPLPNSPILNYSDTIVQVYDLHPNSIYYNIDDDVSFIAWNGFEGNEYVIDVWGDTSIIIDIITLDGCIVNDTINIFTYFIDVYIPNAFSPNDDGFNDIFTIYSKSPLIKKKLTIFDRWGNTIHESYDGTWDGMFNDEECGLGVYAYLFNIEFQNGYSQIKYGGVTLLR